MYKTEPIIHHFCASFFPFVPKHSQKYPTSLHYWPKLASNIPMPRTQWMTIFYIQITFILRFCSLLFKLACKTNVKSQSPPQHHTLTPLFRCCCKDCFFLLGFRVVLKRGSLAAVSSQRYRCWVKLTSATNFASKACKIQSEKEKKRTKRKRGGGKKTRKKTEKALELHPRIKNQSDLFPFRNINYSSIIQCLEQHKRSFETNSHTQ